VFPERFDAAALLLRTDDPLRVEYVDQRVAALLPGQHRMLDA
jgi:hypothetical protein